MIKEKGKVFIKIRWRSHYSSQIFDKSKRYLPRTLLLPGIKKAIEDLRDSLSHQCSHKYLTLFPAPRDT